MLRLSLFALALVAALFAALVPASAAAAAAATGPSSKKTAPRLQARRRLHAETLDDLGPVTPFRIISNGIADTIGGGAVAAGEAVAAVGAGLVNLDPLTVGEAVAAGEAGSIAVPGRRLRRRSASRRS